MSAVATSGRMRWLSFTRVAWVAVAALALGLDAAGFLYAFEKYKTACTGEPCFGALTPETLRALHEMGLSAAFFGGYVVVVQITVMLVFAGVSAVLFALIQGSITLVPLSMGVAILRSRLYDIDIVINRTLVYGALSVALALVYFGTIALLQGALIAITGQEESQLAVVASTLLIAALFDPIRRRTQDLVDRRLHRGKYDAERIQATFSGWLRDETDLDRLSEDLLVVVRETVRPEYVSLWLRDRGGRG